MPKKELRQQSSDRNLRKGQGEPESQEVRLARESELALALDRQNIHRYLTGLQPNSEADLVACRQIGNSNYELERELKNGSLAIAPQPSPLPESYKLVKLTPEEQKEAEAKTKRQELHKKLEYLNGQIRPEPQGQQTGNRLVVEMKDILSKEQHQNIVREIMAQKAELKKRLEDAAQEEVRRRKEQQDRELEMRNIEIEKQRQQKRQAIQESIRKRKAEQEKNAQLEKQKQKQLQALRGKQWLYQKMEQRYQSQVLLPSLEQKKNKLKQLREFHGRYDVDSIKEHEKKCKQLQEQRTKRQKSQEKVNNQSLYQPPARSQRMSKLLQQEANSLKQQLSTKKAKNEQMQRRLQLFEKEVMSHHRPRIDEQKKQEILLRYHNEDKKQQRMTVDGRKLGENYLEIAKKMRRSDSHRQQAKTQEEEKEKANARAGTSQPNLQLSQAYNRSQDFYQGLRRKRIQDIVNSQETSREKFHLLSLQAQKLSEKIRQKEQLARLGGDQEAQQQAAQLILTSIKAKMGIMNVLRHNNAQAKPGTTSSDSD